MGATYNGRTEIARFHRWMLKFAPDSVIEFSNPCAADGRLYLEWLWSGTFEGALRLPDGSSVQSTGANFSVPGVAACRYAANGELQSHRDYWDLNTLLRQAGAS
jgi:SnoaL-like polyketide cyclase